LLDGVYRGTPIAPARSGKAGKSITYRAANAKMAILTESQAMPGPFPDDESGLPAAIFLIDRSHIVIDGIAVEDPGGRFLYANGASFITVQNCHFENTEYPIPWESCRFKRVGDHITFRNNVVKKGNDSIAITGGSFHLVEGNTFEGASHTCLVLMGVQRSVVRGNTLTNPIQKLMEVFTGRGRDFGEVIRKSEYVVIEDNFFGPAPTTAPGGKGKDFGSAAIQYAGNNTILRRNVYFKCGMGMDFSRYECGTDEDPEARYCSHNRFYNNTVYDCGWPARYGSGPGIWISNAQDGIEDNVLVNNVLYRNHAHPDVGFPPSTPYDVQLAFADAGKFLLLRNVLMGREKDAVTVWDKQQKTGFALSAFEDQFPRTARENVEAEPEFVDAEKGDFRLIAGSPCIDAGMPLTAARSSGEGTVIEVEDALYFCDGHGIVDPDVVRVGKERVKVTAVDYEANSMTLDRSISWDRGDSVTLDYAGDGPDLGAVESDGSPGK
ncbi:MAG: right-handed parallel beta-helix repeat-containing protein, partial [Armatimonadetes bacterium]|nr:right-handed parallel beta-helix repeat-containing protein [Armatimonadota bacterium]